MWSVLKHEPQHKSFEPLIKFLVTLLLIRSSQVFVHGSATYKVQLLDTRYITDVCTYVCTNSYVSNNTHIAKYLTTSLQIIFHMHQSLTGN